MKRMHFLDYAKALSIFTVVAIHIGFYQLNKVVLFAMPLFFLVTGYSYTAGKRRFRDSTLRRFRSVLLPFWGLMALYTVIEVIRAPLFGYGTWEILFPSLAKAVYGSGMIPIEGPITDYLFDLMSYKAQTDVGVDVILPSSCHLWFLPAAFTAYVIFTAIVEKVRKNKYLLALSMIGLLAFASLEAVVPYLCQLPYGVGRGAIGAAWMLVGFLLKESNALERCTKLAHVLSSLACAVLYAGAILLGSDGSAMVRSVYGPYGALSVLITFVGGTAGVWLMLELCRAIEKLPLEPIKRLLSYTGRNVMIVYAMHMAVKFLLDVIYIFILNPSEETLLDEYMMGLTPDRSSPYMILEVLLTIILCLLLARLIETLRSRKRKSGDA